mmetsp:Transcript_91998/g.269123  ORF Transcript_91998/g.269123 Transcript_91998/m.269123 type:complete len:483 (-) Transcript_91998:81-1529(-)
MASASSFWAASAAIVLLLCLGAAGSDRDDGFDERGALSPGLSDKGLVTTGMLRDLEPQRACNVVKPMPPGVRYIRSALFCVLKQYMMDSWAGSEELALQLSQLRRRERMPRLGGPGHVADSSVQEELDKSLQRVLKEAEPTGTDGPKALLTSDERFRLRPLLEDEYAFWKEHGEAIMRRWATDTRSALARHYAVVAEGPDPTSQKWILTREAANQTQRKYVLTGQDSTGADSEEDGDHWPQYLYFTAAPLPEPAKEPEAAGWFSFGWGATTQAPTAKPSPPRLVATYKQFYAAVEKDVALLEKLNVPDYSLVVRIAPAEPAKGRLPEPWRHYNSGVETLETWEAFPQFQGAGILFKTMHWPPAKTFDIAAGKPFEVSVEIVDYLRGAKEPGSHSDSLLRRVRRKFRPFTFDRKGGTPTSPKFRCCISNPEAVQGDPSQEELEELARNETLPPGICDAALFKSIDVHQGRNRGGPGRSYNLGA